MLCSVSETTTSENLTVIGGLHSGWKLAVKVSENSALPFCTGKSPAAETDSLLTALGCFPPLLMHSAVAVTSMWTWVSLPRPASLTHSPGVSGAIPRVSGGQLPVWPRCPVDLVQMGAWALRRAGWDSNHGLSTRLRA